MILNGSKGFTMSYLDGREKEETNKEDPENQYLFFKTTGGNRKSAIGGWGMMKRQQPQQMICYFITISSIDNYSSKVEQLGGKILVPKTAAKGHGYFAVCSDTENNHLGIFEEDANVK